MNTADKIDWHTPKTPPPIDGAYLCDIGDAEPVIMVYKGGHWRFELLRMAAKDEWVRYWSYLPEQIR